MALNLNKSDDETSKPPAEKKGLNLSKSGDSDKAKPDLTKEKVDTTSIPPSAETKGLNLSKSGDSDKAKPDLPKEKVDTAITFPPPSEAEVKKKSPMIYLIVALAVIGLTVFFINKTSKSTAPPSDKVKVKDTPPVVIDTPAPPDEDTVAVPQPPIDVPPIDVPPIIEVPPIIVKSPNTGEVLTGTLEEKAKQVISGAFSNGPGRKRVLGDQYEEIQAKINELYRAKK